MLFASFAASRESFPAVTQMSSASCFRAEAKPVDRAGGTGSDTKPLLPPFPPVKKFHARREPVGTVS